MGNQGKCDFSSSVILLLLLPTGYCLHFLMSNEKEKNNPEELALLEACTTVQAFHFWILSQYQLFSVIPFLLEHFHVSLRHSSWLHYHSYPGPLSLQQDFVPPVTGNIWGICSYLGHPDSHESPIRTTSSF